MKIVEQSAGALTNFEVLNLLRSRGAAKDASRVMAHVSPSEYKVFDYLEQTPAFNQTTDIIRKFAEECKIYDLSKAEILNVANIRPSSPVEVYTIIEKCELRMEEKVEDLVEAITRILPPHPSQKDEPDEETSNDKEGDEEKEESNDKGDKEKEESNGKVGDEEKGDEEKEEDKEEEEEEEANRKEGDEEKEETME